MGLEPQSSPGAPALWCLTSDWEYQLSVGVEGDAISVFLVDDDLELLLPDPASLVGWLDANERCSSGVATYPAKRSRRS